MWRGHNYCRLDGSTPHEDRQVCVLGSAAVRGADWLGLICEAVVHVYTAAFQCLFYQNVAAVSSFLSCTSILHMFFFCLCL